MSAYDEDLLDEEDEEAPMTERDLADDAQWKIIQKNTFTRWANEHLKTVNKQLNDLENDFSDGLRLVALIEVLSGKKFSKYSKRPNFRTQKLENVTMVLEFLEQDEGIRIVNIDSGDIVDHKLKLILGLIWTLILHYSISMPMWEGEEPQPQEGGPTPKQRLLNWINSKVPDLPIKNFTTDWNDGKAIGALVDAIAPGLCPDWEDWDPKKAKANAKEAMDAAEKWLDVPQLIKPDEMTNPKVDDLSMMTYLSQFPQAKLKPGAPLRPPLNAGKVRAYGPGIQPKGNMVNKPANFTVETFGAGKGSLEVMVLDPKGKPAQCDSKPNNDQKMTYSCVYVPAMEGEYRVIIKFGEKEIAKSPYKVKVEGAAGDPTKVTAAGPGLEKTGVIVSQKTYFEVFTKDAGKGSVDVTILDPSGHRDRVKPTITSSKKEGVYMVEYTPLEIGEHTITITFNMTAIPKCPYHVTVGSAINSKAVYATGRGIQPKGVRVKQNATFKVHTKDAGKAEVKVQIIGPGGVNLNCTVKPSKTEEGVYECLYIPPKVGQYVINVTFGGQNITKSPFRVDVGPEKTSKIVAYGPGLEGGVVNQPACFTVETNGETGALGFSIEGPSQAKIDCKDNGDGSADVTYWPTMPGEYAVHILCDEEDIPQAPYMAQIQPATTAFDASKVVAKGPGLEKDGVVVGKPTDFTVDAKKAGKAPLHITCIDANYKPVEVTVLDNKDNTFYCKYTAKVSCRHTIIITWGTVGIPKSPFRVNVSEPVNPGNVKVYGPGVEKGVKTWVLTHFTVDCRSAGPGDVAIALTDANGKDVPVNTIDNNDGTFTIEYEPRIPGTYTVAVFFAGKEIPKSPIKVKVESSIDLSKVTVKGLEKPIPLGETRLVYIVTMGLPKKDAPCKVTVTTPKNKTVELPVKKSPEGYTCDFKPTEKGEHKVEVTYDKKPAPDSPYKVEVTEPKKAEVVVRGLETPIEVGENRPVIIDTSAMPKKDLPCKATVTNPKNKTVELPLKKTPQGYTTTFTPKEAGPHKVTITYDLKPVPKSPFTVDVQPKGSKPKFQVEIHGLDTPIQTGEKRVITVVVKIGNKSAPCKITATSPKGRSTDLKTKPNAEGCETVYTPWDSGIHKIKIEFDSKEVPKSPFEVEVFKINLSAIVVKGLDKPIPLGETRKISIITKDCGKPDLPCKVTVTNPQGKKSDLPTKQTPEGYDCDFTPESPGEYKVTVEYAAKEVPKSPFTVHVEVSDITPKKAAKPVEAAPSKPTDAKPTGAKPGVGDVVVKGLDTPILAGEKRDIKVIAPGPAKPNKFAPPPTCKITVSNPKGRTFEPKVDKTPEGFETFYQSNEPGPHVFKIEHNGKEIPDSPITVEVEKMEVRKVEVKGLETPIEVGEVRPIEINTASTGKLHAPCKVTAEGPKGDKKDLPCKETPQGYETSYAPLETGPHKVKVEYGGKETPKSPYPVEVVPKTKGPKDAKEPKVQVKGLETPVTVGEKRPVTVTSDKPDTPCKISQITPKGQTSEIPTKKIKDGVEATFAPVEEGPYKVKVELAGKEVPGSPFPVEVKPKVDLSKVEVKGLETPVKVGENRPVTIVTKSTGKPDAPCKVTVVGPNGKATDCPTKKTPEGYETTFAPLEKGPHVVKVDVDNKPVPKSPFNVDVQTTVDYSKVAIKGLERPVEVNEVRPIITVTKGTGDENAPVQATVTTPEGRSLYLPTKKVPEGYESTFNPKEKGPHKIQIDFAGKEVPQSPVTVDVKEKFNIKKVQVKGLEKPIDLGETRPVTVVTSSCGKPDAPCKVFAKTPTTPFKELPTKKVPEGYECQFTPDTPGANELRVVVDETDLPDSPFFVKVVSDVDTSKVEIKGLESPIEVGEARPIQVNTASTGRPDAPCRVQVSNPKGQTAELPLQKTPDGYQTVFAPLEPGPHKVDVNFAEKPVPKSPFNVDVQPQVNIGAVEVLGLETPIAVGEPRPITIMTSTTGKPDAPCKVQVTNPFGQVKELPTQKIPEGYTCTLAPQQEGPHKVNVNFNDKEVPKSPFNVMAETPIDFSKVKVSGLEKPVEVGEIRPVLVETANCGKVDAPCQLTATNPAGQVRELPLQKTPTGYQAQFAPQEVGPHLVAAKYAGKEVPNSPFKVDAVPQGPPCSKVKAYGPGLERGTAEQPCQFTIDTREVTQPGGLGVTVEGPAESKIECRDNQDGTCDVTYYPTVPGDYNVNITYADEHIPNSPFTAKVLPSGKYDVSQVKAYGPGLEPGVFLDSPTGFTVDAKSVTPSGEGKVRAIVTSPSGQKTESLVKNNNDGTYDVLYTPYQEGANTIDITYEDHPIPQSPVQVNATPGCDASRVKAYGPGLESGVTFAKQTFTVDVKGAGKGGLALAIDGPSETQINCKDNRDGTCEVEYVPVKKGDYDITVKFADQNIPGSPFNVKVKDEVNPTKVKCYGQGLEPEQVKANQPNTFTVDAKEAGEAPLDVSFTDTTGLTKPAEIVPVEEGVYQASYFPVEEGPCTVNVNYANQAVPNSPFRVDVKPGIDANKVEIVGPGVQPTIAASMPVQFTVDTRKAGPADIVPDALIQRPDGTVIRPMLQKNPDGTYLCQYTPEDCGQYNINVNYAGQPCRPVQTTAVPTGDASKCRITEGLQQTIQVDKQTVITVDASAAGEGKVTCRIRSPSGAEIDIDIVENIDGTFNIQFTPSFPGDYSISIKFGGQSIPNGDYIVQCGDLQEELIQADTIDATQSAFPGAGVYHPQEFCIPIGPIFNFVTAYVIMPSGKKAYPKIEDNKDGTVTIRYQPCETGTHELHLCYNTQEIQGSPFKFHVDAIDSGFVTAYGPGLSHGIVNVPAEFTIVTKDAGAGGLSLAIEGPSKTEIKCKDNEDGTCTVTYLPTAPGEYVITVKFADKNISGSPFVAKVTPGEPKQKAMIGRSSEVSLKITETDITNLTASIRSPSGHEEPCMLKRLPNGHLGISFTPRETGEHLVNVFRDGQHIPNSPFKITVGESELGNASKVKVYGKGLQEGMANEVNEFVVDTREAGYGGLSLSIEGPSKADIECHDNEDGTCRVTYKPTEPGTYIINIKFADEHVPGSPFKVKIGGEASERITERIMRHREAVDVTHVGSECELSLKIPASFIMRMTGYSVSQIDTTGTSPFDMTASVTSPNGVTELCDVVSLDDCHYSIKFVPKEMGIHTVSVKHKDMHIPGSPFQFTVGPIAGGGAHKVHAAGLGLVRGEVDQSNEFNIYTREAGAGGLSIAVEGPSKAEVDFEDRKDGSCGVTYNVTEPGEYLVSIKFNDEHIPESPFRVPISPSIGDARKISVSALQNKGLTIGKPAAFVVNFNGAPKGKLQARVVSPSGAEDSALIQEIDDGEYAVRFIPRENGPHLVYVSFDGCQIPDSPFRVQVGTVHADPGMVQAYGEGLKAGKTGQVCKFIVNTCNAGSGALAVTVEGPSKVKLECREVDEGYEFTYNPTAPGDYLITIKYAGTNIAGSPYKARIEGQGQPSGYQEQASVVVETVTKTSIMSKFASLPPFESDASKVTVEGNGLKKGYRNKQCSFNIDTSKAGMNMLFIGMIGPKGPCEELCVKHIPGSPYKITYLVKERGDYMLAVKWGEEHIPGSPFYVKVD